MTPEQLAALVADAEQTRPDDHVVRDLIAGLRWLADLHNTTADTLALVDSPLKRRAQDLLLAERDALTAEVARLSAPPDDAEVAEMVQVYRSCAKSLEHEHGFVAKGLRRRHEATADALTRLSHALAAETAKREAMEKALRALIAACRGEPSEVFAGEIGKPLKRARATLAKHGSKT